MSRFTGVHGFSHNVDLVGFRQWCRGGVLRDPVDPTGRGPEVDGFRPSTRGPTTFGSFSLLWKRQRLLYKTRTREGCRRSFSGTFTKEIGSFSYPRPLSSGPELNKTSTNSMDIWKRLEERGGNFTSIG